MCICDYLKWCGISFALFFLYLCVWISVLRLRVLVGTDIRLVLSRSSIDSTI